MGSDVPTYPGRWLRSCGLTAVLLAGCAGAVLAQAPTQLPAPSRTASDSNRAYGSARRLAAWVEDYAALPRLDVSALGAPYRPAIFAQVQLRTEADRLQPERQRYSIRAEPRLPYVRKAERELQAAQRATLPTLDGPARREAAAEALAFLFELAAAERQLGGLDREIALHDSLAAVMRLRLAEPDFDVERVLDVEDDLSELTAERAAVAARLRRHELPVAAGELASATTALSRAADLVAHGVRPDERLSAELALIDAEVAFERAENWKVIDFVQVDYRSDLEDRGERYSLGFGLALPHARVRQLDELAVERVEESHEARLDDAERARELAEAYEALLAAADELYALQSAAADRRRRRARLAAALRTSAQTRPDDLLRIRRRDLRDAREITEAEGEVLEAYGELVGRSGWVGAEGLESWVLE